MRCNKIIVFSSTLLFVLFAVAFPAKAATKPLQSTTASHPVHISISAGKVNTSVIKVGITPQGNLDVPPNFVQAGWYQYGVIPGQQGSAVIDGHVDNGGAVPGPFKNLKKVKVGDTITVTMNDGKNLHFSITDATIYPTKNFPSDLIFNQKGKAYLKIITCNGTFVPADGTYDKRLVVTAVLAA